MDKVELINLCIKKTSLEEIYNIIEPINQDSLSHILSIIKETLLTKIKGNINVSELLALKATAKLTGDIVASKIAIEPEAIFTGSCRMGGVVKNILNNNESRNESKSKSANNQ